MGILQQVRFIPTYVGYTYWLIYGASRRPVHPHIRGAYVPIKIKPWSWIGSSPHTWGILPVPGWRPGCRRFIPTYVGHTCCPPRWRPGKSVHPHIRGAYVAPARGDEPRTVHPHIRGAYALGFLRIGEANRFIPTYVGHTVGGRLGKPGRSVHPHIRGAYAMAGM